MEIYRDTIKVIDEKLVKIVVCSLKESGYIVREKYFRNSEGYLDQALIHVYEYTNK